MDSKGQTLQERPSCPRSRLIGAEVRRMWPKALGGSEFSAEAEQKLYSAPREAFVTGFHIETFEDCLQMVWLSAGLSPEICG